MMQVPEKALERTCLEAPPIKFCSIAGARRQRHWPPSSELAIRTSSHRSRNCLSVFRMKRMSPACILPCPGKKHWIVAPE